MGKQFVKRPIADSAVITQFHEFEHNNMPDNAAYIMLYDRNQTTIGSTLVGAVAEQVVRPGDRSCQFVTMIDTDPAQRASLCSV